MNIEYKYEMNKDEVKRRIDEYTEKLNNLQFTGGFIIEDLKKSWTDDEMQLSFTLKKMIIDRRIEGTFRFKDRLMIMDFELPDIIRNLLTNENLERTIRLNLDNIMQE